MKPKSELTGMIEKIVDKSSPVGMDAVYVHALILDKLQQIDDRLSRLESGLEAAKSAVRSSGKISS